MSNFPLETVATGLLALCLLIAAGTDLKARTIPNPLVVVIALSAPVWWWINGLSLWPDVAWQLGVALTLMIFFTGLFAIGQIGGGDVKLIGALALWFPPIPMVQLLVVMSILGGALTLVMLILHKLRKKDGLPVTPYGVAIAVAGLWALYQRNLNHFA